MEDDNKYKIDLSGKFHTALSKPQNQKIKLSCKQNKVCRFIIENDHNFDRIEDLTTVFLKKGST